MTSVEEKVWLSLSKVSGLFVLFVLVTNARQCFSTYSYSGF